MVTKYLVKTDHGDVVVRINEAADSGLAADLIALEAPGPENTRDIELEVPLRAFGAKMLEIVEMLGAAEIPSETVRRMMVQEKATGELKRIERFARQRAADGEAS